MMTAIIFHQVVLEDRQEEAPLEAVSLVEAQEAVAQARVGKNYIYTKDLSTYTNSRRFI